MNLLLSSARPASLTHSGRQAPKTAPNPDSEASVHKMVDYQGSVQSATGKGSNPAMCFTSSAACDQALQCSW